MKFNFFFVLSNLRTSSSQTCLKNNIDIQFVIVHMIMKVDIEISKCLTFVFEDKFRLLIEDSRDIDKLIEAQKVVKISLKE